MRELSLDEPRRWEILRAIERALDVLDPQDVAGTGRGRPRRARRGARASGPRRAPTGSRRSATPTSTPPGCGRCARPIRKVARTVANVVALMDDDPDVPSSRCRRRSSSPGSRTHQPELFARVQEQVASGQFVPVGGMWVESDTNMPGGESLARQFVARQAVLPRGVRRRDRGGLAAGLLRLLRGAAPADPALRVALVPHPEALVEPDQHVPPPHLPLGGHRRDARLQPLPARGHVQLASCPAPSWPVRRGTSARRAARRGRSCRSDGATAAAARPARCSPAPHRTADLEGSPRVAIESPARLLRARPRPSTRSRAGVVGRAVPRAPPRHLHQPGPDQAGQPPQRAPAPRGRAVVGDRGRRRA